MNIGIIYCSKTGNTEKLAEYAAELFTDLSNNVSLIPIKKYNYKNEQLFDLLIIGSYCDSNSMARPVLKLFNSLHKNKNIACFVTHSTYDSGPYYDSWAKGCETYFRQYCKDNSIERYNYFHCRGKPPRLISIFIKMMVFKKEKDDWKNYRADMNAYPDENDINNFRNFIMNLVKDKK